MADLVVTATTVVPSVGAQITRNRVAGATITAGQLVYIAADGTVKLADANGATPLFKIAGIALNAASAGQPIDFCFSDPALTIVASVPIVAGDILIASATPGSIGAAADAATGWYVTVVGLGIGSNQVMFGLLSAGVPK